MQTIDAIQGGARTYFVHTFGRGLDGEDRFVVERFRVQGHTAALSRTSRCPYM